MRHESNIVILSEVVLDISKINLKAAGDVVLLKMRSAFDFSATQKEEVKMRGNVEKSSFNIVRANKNICITQKKVSPKCLAIKTDNLKLLSYF